MQTADGVPYWKIALLHLDSIASTVVQKCIYWDTHEQCGFCGIELTRGEQTCRSRRRRSSPRCARRRATTTTRST
jgi:hypothetical protein